MTDQPDPRGPLDDFRETAARSQEANIADKQAGHIQGTAPSDTLAGHADGIPQTGEEDPLAEVSDGDFAEVVGEYARSEQNAGPSADDVSADVSDSIEPGRTRWT